MKMREQIRTLIAPERLPLLHSFFFINNYLKLAAAEGEKIVS